MRCGIAEIGADSRRDIAKRTIRSDSVVIILPIAERFVRVIERNKEHLI
jgi:hypothetical protein